MSDRSAELLIEDILESALKIRRYTSGLTFEEFLSDEMAIDAVIRNFEVIGEASGRLSDDFRESNKQIDWKKIRGFRNRIVHDYFGIDHSIVWNIIQNFLPDLIEQIDLLSKSGTK